MAVYQGNHVAYGAGGIWHVQVVVTDDGGNAGDTTTVHYTYQIVFTQSVSDTSNTINWSDAWGNGSRNNFPFSGPGTYTISGTYSASAAIVLGGGNSIRFRMYATGMAGGGTGPSVVEFDYPLPARTGSPPSPPGVGIDSILPTSARVVITPPSNNGGLAIDAYDSCVLRNNAFPYAGGEIVVSVPGGTFTATGLSPGTRYFATSRAHNPAGLSGWAPIVGFDTLPGAFINVNGQYKLAIPYVNDNGEWKMAVPYAKVNDVWRQVTG